MLDISYESWVDVCNMFFELENATLCSYLQLYPLAILNNQDKDYLRSKEFYNKYIKIASFVFFEDCMLQTENFLTKSDGSFRDAYLVDPVLFLAIQAIGKDINNNYIVNRQDEFKAYYSGNYNMKKASYKKEYAKFVDEINDCKDEYDFFIKTDLKDFFSNIDINKLFDLIAENYTDNKIKFNINKLYAIKRLIMYSGNGKFPLLENSISSSFLSTIVYLDKIDYELFEFLESQKRIKFKILRYVDDLYVLIKSEMNDKENEMLYNEFLGKYTSLLKKYNLKLNKSKCCKKLVGEIDCELKKSDYGKQNVINKEDVEMYLKGNLEQFLDTIIKLSKYKMIDFKKYNELIERYFAMEVNGLVAQQVYNYFIYDKDLWKDKEAIVHKLDYLISSKYHFIMLDPKRFTLLILKTKNENLIKSLLNVLFNRYRNEKWNVYDSIVMITYLIQKGFMHNDLIIILKNKLPEIELYRQNNCKLKFVENLNDDFINHSIEILGDEWKMRYLYFMYICEYKERNYLLSYSYFKNFFDGFTANIDRYINNNKKVNYKGFYHSKQLKKFYKEIKNSERILKKAYKIRNENSVAHASSNLLENERFGKKEIDESINELKYLLKEYIKSNTYKK